MGYNSTQEVYNGNVRPGVNVQEEIDVISLMIKNNDIEGISKRYDTTIDQAKYIAKIIGDRYIYADVTYYHEENGAVHIGIDEDEPTGTHYYDHALAVLMSLLCVNPMEIRYIGEDGETWGYSISKGGVEAMSGVSIMDRVAYVSTTNGGSEPPKYDISVHVDCKQCGEHIGKYSLQETHIMYGDVETHTAKGCTANDAQ